MSISPRLRKAAILVSTIDVRTGDSLLEQMGEAQANLVRAAVLELDDISESERESVLEEFLSSRPHRRDDAGSGVEIDAELARKFASSAKAPAAVIRHPQDNPMESHIDGSQKTATRSEAAAGEGRSNEPAGSSHAAFQFLRDAEISRLVECLRKEHPQTIAVVVSHLAPEQAAQLFPAWPPSLRMEVMRRMERLDQTDPEVLRDIEQGLQSLLASSIVEETPRSMGVQAISAILKAMTSENRASMLAGLSRYDMRLAETLSSETLRDASSQAKESLSATKPSGGREDRRSGELEQAYAAKLGAAPRDDAMFREATLAGGQIESRDDSWSGEEHLPATSASQLQSYTFAEVAKLNAKALALVLHYADPQVVLLAFAGAEESTYQALTRGMDPADVRTMERRLNRLGSLRLRDIDAAQEAIAKTATELASRGLIPLSATRELMATV